MSYDTENTRENMNIKNKYNLEIKTTYLEENDYDKSDDLYRIQYLQVFNVDKYDFDKINDTLYILYDIIKEELFFKDIMKAFADNPPIQLSISEENLILFLYQYDYFHYFHTLLQHYFQNEHYNEYKSILLDKIKKDKNEKDNNK